LLRASFVPPRPQRELRDLTRQRSTLVRERASVFNRVQKVLEGANIKLASVTSTMTGTSVRDMLAAMVAGESDPVVLAELARGRLRAKRPALEQALTGRMNAHYRFLLDSHLRHIDFLSEQVERYSAEIAACMEQLNAHAEPPDGPASGSPSGTGEMLPQPPNAGMRKGDALTAAQAVALLDTIPGIDRWQAEVILAEIGLDMGRFPTAAHLASWAGLAPGNNESAGKRRSGKTRPGNPTLSKTLVLAAHAAARGKNTYLAAQYHRLAARRGKNRAIVAVAHSILVIVYHLLSRQEPFCELGGNYFDERKRESVTNRLVRRLEKLGYDVALASKPSSASAAA
jgi:transposase